MTHKYSAFIQKNTPEIRKKLEELGYVAGRNRDEEYCIKTYVKEPGFKNSICQTMPFFKENYLRNGVIDCGENEELFFAIAAIRDDSDYMQWFKIEDSLFLCEKQKASEYKLFNFERKATPEELMEYFKKGE